MKMYTFDDMQLEEQVDRSNHLIVNAMVSEGFLTKEQAQKWLEEYAIVIRYPNFFERFLENFKKEENRTNLYVVKRVWP